MVCPNKCKVSTVAKLQQSCILSPLCQTSTVPFFFFSVFYSSTQLLWWTLVPSSTWMGSLPKQKPTTCGLSSSNLMMSLPSRTCGSCGTSWRGRDSGLNARSGCRKAMFELLPHWWCHLLQRYERAGGSNFTKDYFFSDSAHSACERHFEGLRAGIQWTCAASQYAILPYGSSNY